MSTSERADTNTEPSAVAPDAGISTALKGIFLRLSAKLTLASGATALGSVLNVCLIARIFDVFVG
jgi:hypothetical protein